MTETQVIRCGDCVQLINNNLNSLRNKRSKSSNRIPVGTKGTVITFRYREDQPPGEQLEFLVKFVGHSGFRCVPPKNII